MNAQEFAEMAAKYAGTITEIRESAHNLHNHVGQTYDDKLPYGYHLDMVADGVHRFGYAVCVDERHIVPLFFGAFYHDSIEDARLTYNDVVRTARRWMSDDLAIMAAEMVYALTNEKGRTRAERANDKYYHGIRTTPYAPFLKLSDRLANITYSCSHRGEGCCLMKEVYLSELPHFLQAIRSDNADLSYSLPSEMIDELKRMIKC